MRLEQHRRELLAHGLVHCELVLRATRAELRVVALELRRCELGLVERHAPREVDGRRHLQLGRVKLERVGLGDRLVHLVEKPHARAAERRVLTRLLVEQFARLCVLLDRGVDLASEPAVGLHVARLRGERDHRHVARHDLRDHVRRCLADARGHSRHCHRPLVHFVLALVDRAFNQRVRVDVLYRSRLARLVQTVCDGLHARQIRVLQVLVHLLRRE